MANTTKYATQIAAANKGGKILIFKSKFSGFWTIKFSYINLLPYKIDQFFGFLTGQCLKLRRKTCSHGFKSSFAKNFHIPKPSILLLFKRSSYYNDFWPITLRALNIILGAWNGFSGNCPESCHLLFFLNYAFENTAFGHLTEIPTKCWCKENIHLVFLSFTWNFRTWEYLVFLSFRWNSRTW